MLSWSSPAAPGLLCCALPLLHCLPCCARPPLQKPEVPAYFNDSKASNIEVGRWGTESGDGGDALYSNAKHENENPN